MESSRKILASSSLSLELSVRLVLWLVFSLTLSTIFLREFWASLPDMLSLNWVLGQHNASPWGILALCFIFLWLKRKQVWDKMRQSPSLVLVPIGLAITAGALLMPSLQDYLVFQVLLVFLGVFVICFGRGAKMPSILLAIYGFAVSFPLAIEHFADYAYSRIAIAPVTWLITTLGYSLRNEGQWIHFMSFTGEPISVVVTAGCAGPATTGFLIALFALMMLDMPLPPKKAIGLFLFGVVGTWFQSFVRLVILMLVGYYLGEQALWTAHFWTIYILFPLWYLLFAYIYFRQFGRLRRVVELPVTVKDGCEV